MSMRLDHAEVLAGTAMSQVKLSPFTFFKTKCTLLSATVVVPLMVISELLEKSNWLNTLSWVRPAKSSPLTLVMVGAGKGWDSN